MESNEDLFEISGVSATSTPKKRRPTCPPKHFQEYVMGSKRCSADESQADEQTFIINNDETYFMDTNIEIVYEDGGDDQPLLAYFVPTSQCIFVGDEVENSTSDGPSSQPSGENSTVFYEISTQSSDADEDLSRSQSAKEIGADDQPPSSSDLPIPKINSVENENEEDVEPCETYFVPTSGSIFVGDEVENGTPTGHSSQHSGEDSTAVDMMVPRRSGEVLSKRCSAKRNRRHAKPSCSNNVTKSRKSLSHLDTTVNYGSEDESDQGASEDESDQGASDDDIPVERYFLPKSMQIFVPEEVEDENPADLLLERSSQDVLPWMGVHEFSPDCLGPNDLFDFKWEKISSNTVYPSDRREDFQAAVGPVGVFESPYAAFTAIWSPDVLRKIAKETNKHAQYLIEKKMRNSSLGASSRISSWQEVTVNELYIYFALIIEMGVTVKSNIKEYWTKKSMSATPYFTQQMSFNRFTLISSCLHFVDNRTDISSLRLPQARIFKISPILHHLNSKFQKLYNLNRDIALDESLTQWKGLLGINQFIKNKAAKIGIKTYEICDSQTGYLWRFKVHAGREDIAVLRTMPSLGYIGAVVVELLQGLENVGHCVWLDNFYNSPALARVLKTKGFDCAGTLRPNRHYVPPNLRLMNNLNMTGGQIFGYTAGDVDVMMWRDKRCVAMISTYHGIDFNRNGARAKPRVVCDYNLNMGGVDRKDQILSMYPMERKRTRIWYKKLFRRLLNASVLNSFILHRDSGTKHISNHRKFRRVLVDQLLVRHQRTPPPEFSIPSLYNRSRKLPQEVLNHFPKQYGTKKGTNEKLRYTCVLCKTRQNCYCSVCNVSLCLNCTVLYHSRMFDI